MRELQINMRCGSIDTQKNEKTDIIHISDIGIAVFGHVHWL